MPNPLNNVACADTFPIDGQGASISEVWTPGGGAFQIQNQPAIYKVQYGGRDGAYWTDEQQIGVGGGVIPLLANGVSFRNAVAGKIATVSAYIVYKGQPLLSLTFPGSVSGTLVTGIVKSDGTLIAGSGFTPSRTGVGRYHIGFATAFGAVPIVLALALPNPIGDSTAFANNVTVNGFDLGINSAGAAADLNWNFTAQATN